MSTVTEITVNGQCAATLTSSTCTNSTFRVYIQFLDSQSGAALTLDSAPLFSVVSARTEDTVLASTAMTGPDLTGRYYILLTLNDYDPGLYRFVATGTSDSGVTPVRLEGSFNVYEPTLEQTLVFMVKNRLHDLEAELYKLDLPIPKWSEDAIYQELVMGLSDLSTKPPTPNSNLTFTTAPPHHLVQFAFAQCLLSAAILENWNTYTMSDGSASLNLNRAQLLSSLGQTALQRYDQEAIKWKTSVRPRIKGQGTALFPLQIRRAIGFLPNMKQVFGP